MVNPMSIVTAVQTYRLSRKTGSVMLSNDSESWFASTAFVADVVCRDKIMSVIMNPYQMGIFNFSNTIYKIDWVFSQVFDGHTAGMLGLVCAFTLEGERTFLPIGIKPFGKGKTQADCYDCLKSVNCWFKNTNQDFEIFSERHYLNRNQDYCLEMQRENIDTAEISKELKRLSKEIGRFIERGQLKLGASYSDILAKSAACISFPKRFFLFIKLLRMEKRLWKRYVQTIYLKWFVNFCLIWMISPLGSMICWKSIRPCGVDVSATKSKISEKVQRWYFSFMF